MLKNFKSKFKNYFEKVMKTKKGLRSIALGFSIGAFITILPTPGLNILLGLLMIFLLPYISKYALFTAYFVFNGIVKTPIYLFALYLGTQLFGNKQELLLNTSLINLGTMFTKNFILGVLIVDIVLAVLSYHFVYHFVKYFRARLNNKENQ